MSTSSPPPAGPPSAPQRHHIWDRPTGPTSDPWAWLRDRDDPATLEYLAAENAWTDAWFAPHRPLIETLFQEIKGRIQETDEAVAVRKGSWWYTTRTVEGLDYAVRCRGRSVAAATEHVMLDENAEAEGADFFELGAFDVSPSEDLLAWSLDTDGSEQYEMRVRDLASGHDLPDRLMRTYYGTAWSADSSTLFYVVPDAAMRPYQVWRHRLGTEQGDDALVFEELDEKFYVDVDLSRDGGWIVIGSGSKTTSEVLLIPAGDPTQPPTSVLGRNEGIEYSIEPWRERLLVLTNADGAEDFEIRVMHGLSAGQEPFVDHEPGRRITGVEAFDGHVVIHEWSTGQPQWRVIFADGREWNPDLGDEPSDIELDANPEYSTTTIRWVKQSLTQPRTVYEDDVVSGARSMLKQTPVLGVDLDAYTSRRMWATAPDGTAVPYDIVHHVDTPLDATARTMLYGYGSYESSMAPWFSAARLSLLDRGWVFAVAHPRGGGEMGRRWYLDGKLLHKRNTFTDFIACAHDLVAQRIAAPGKVAIRGGSAGGLLVGAAVTIEPETFAAVVAEVPFVDVVTTMSDPSLPLTIGEWEEWGDPRAEPYASYMLSYSPYDNIAAVPYPPIYVTAGLNDPRVAFHEPAKWVAKLRHIATPSSGALLMKTEMGAGHGGPSGRYDAWRDEAQTLAFLLAAV